jgi:hypothetical protein
MKEVTMAKNFENTGLASQARNASIKRIITAHQAEYDAIYDDERTSRGLPKISEMSDVRIHAVAGMVKNRLLSKDERDKLMKLLFEDE